MSKSGAAFSAAVFHYLPAGLGCHPFHKTMFAGALAFFGLVSSFWHVFLLS
jgi:hypothetical protein